ncbi:MAG TPA: DUF2249 domain-containing protein, partial [Candidatus Acidoferrales bacterium]|nr:DUF2249 domain-containing protein [Candidatus Acidoferrales bacterium]
MSDATTTQPVERVDLRELPSWERHDRVLSSFDRLTPGQAAEFVNDYEPKALRTHLEAEREGIVLWDVRNAGDNRWIIRLTRLPDPSMQGDTPRIAFLRQVRMFRSAPIDLLREIDRAAKERSYHDRMVIVAEGTNWPTLGLVRRGVVEVTRAADEGREIVLYDVSPYSMFNEAAVFDEGTAEATVIARGEVEIIELPAQFVRGLVQRSPEIALGMGRFF